MILNAMAYSAMAALIKFTAEDAPIFVIMFVTVATQFAFFGMTSVRSLKNDLVSNPRLGAHVVRSVALIGSMLTGYWAVTVLPLTVSTAVSFSKAIFVTLFAGVILRETVGARRWLAVVVGFAGIFILSAQGSTDGTTVLGLLAGILSAALAAAGAIWTRRLSATESSHSLLLVQALIGTTVMAPLAAWTWTPPSASATFALFTMGLLSVLGNLSMIAALHRGEASLLAPIDFTRAIFAALLGWPLFSELLDLQAIVGITVIVSSTLLSLRR